MSLSVLRGGIGPLTLGGKAPVTPWWLAGGVNPANVVAAYQPKGALSLADSYKNKANPGVYGAAPGVAPTWAATTGWTFDGSSQWLNTGYVPNASQVHSVIVRFSSVTNNGSLFGWGLTNTFELYRIAPNNSGVSYINGNASLTKAPGIASGVLAIAGAVAYRNGAVDSGSLGTWSSTPVASIGIGAIHRDDGGLIAYIAASIQGIAFYNNDQSARMAAISAALALI